MNLPPFAHGFVLMIFEHALAALILQIKQAS
jgi:hypothetical protein